jgi:hypothetical protein
LAVIGRKEDLSGTCGLNLYEGEYTDTNYVLSRFILDSDELLDAMVAVLQVVSSDVSCSAHSKALDTVQVGEFRTFLIEDALPVSFHMEVIEGHQRISRPPLLAVPLSNSRQV